MTEDSETHDAALLHGRETLVTGGDEAWIRFLSRLGADQGRLHALTARNAFLDEGVAPERVETYRATGCIVDHRADGSGSVEEATQGWLRPHNGYRRFAKRPDYALGTDGDLQ